MKTPPKTMTAGAGGYHPIHSEPLPVQIAPDAAIERAAAIFRALGDTARLRLLTLLRAGPRCVSEIAEAEQQEISTISQRLRVLRSESLVRRERDGKHIRYSLADDHVRALVDFALAHAQED